MRAKLPPPIDLDALPPLPQTDGGAQAAAKGGSKAPAGPSEAPALPTIGIIESAREGETKDKKIPILIVRWRGIFLTTFDKKLWDYLKAGLGKEAELVLSENKVNIVAIKRIGSRTFDAQGVPEIQMGEDRVKTTAQLFE